MPNGSEGRFPEATRCPCILTPYASPSLGLCRDSDTPFPLLRFPALPNALDSLAPVLGSLAILGAMSNIVIKSHHLTHVGIRQEVNGETVREVVSMQSKAVQTQDEEMRGPEAVSGTGLHLSLGGAWPSYCPVWRAYLAQKAFYENHSSPDPLNQPG